MKLYIVKSFNNILDEVTEEAKKRGYYTENPHEGEAIILWNDVRGECKRLAERYKLLGRKVFVVQHGRGATRDYDQPNKFPMVADYIFVWGACEKRRLERIGLGDHAVIAGSPLTTRLRPRNPHPEKRVLFVPIIMEKEEPENLMVYAKLKEWESKKLFNHVRSLFPHLKKAWATQITNVSPQYAEAVKAGIKKPHEVPHEVTVTPTIPYNALYQNGCLTVACIPGLHDAEKYQAQLMPTKQVDSQHIDRIVSCLQETDLVVCIEEGTMPLLAHAMNIPVIHCDVFNYVMYGGRKYDTIERIQSQATYYTKDIETLPKLIDEVLGKKENEFKLQQRIQVVEDELGPQYGNPAKNMLDFIETSLMPVAMV